MSFKSFCPYRVAPIGAHSDFQYGKITGIALDHGVTLEYEPTENGVVEAVSKNFPGEAQFHVGHVPRTKRGDWADYLRGVTAALARRYPLVRGIRAQIEGTLPIGGLSSSAAVSIAYLAALCRVNDISLTSEEIVETALWAENRYVGINCGRTDQSCEVYARRDHLLYFDTLDGSHECIPDPPSMKPFEIAILFSGLERSLVGSAFNMRTDELQSAAYATLAYAGLPYGRFDEKRLRHIPRKVFEQYKNRLPDAWRRRAEHWYNEQDRVEAGAAAWRRGDIEEYGRLSFESGRSSIELYETGSPELKTLYDIMLHTDGIYGGRFSGAGFKGCCVALIDPAFREEIVRRVTDEYLRAFPQLRSRFSIHFCHSADGICV